MSNDKQRSDALNMQRVDAGIAYGVSVGTLERVMHIVPESIEQEDEQWCFFAQATGMRYDAAMRAYPLSEQRQIDLAFIGEFETLAVGGDTRTGELTPIYRERLRLFQERHRAAA